LSLLEYVATVKGILPALPLVSILWATNVLHRNEGVDSNKRLLPGRVGQMQGQAAAEYCGCPPSGQGRGLSHARRAATGAGQRTWRSDSPGSLWRAGCCPRCRPSSPTSSSRWTTASCTSPTGCAATSRSTTSGAHPAAARALLPSRRLSKTGASLLVCSALHLELW